MARRLYQFLTYRSYRIMKGHARLRAHAQLVVTYAMADMRTGDSEDYGITKGLNRKGIARGEMPIQLPTRAMGACRCPRSAVRHGFGWGPPSIQIETEPMNDKIYGALLPQVRPMMRSDRLCSR